ncbi:DNA polymerase I [Vibrio vulnificus]|uniref:DNA polymerase I n=1 Tax=Vibrio vulnificus TaxID=672 RepID=UPI001194174A|nr:DNA polymerase I [Vibrio cholerae]
MTLELNKTMIIIDGNSFYHRAFHAVPALSNKEGFPTNAITGFCNMVNRAINSISPDKTIVAFDHSGKTFRHDMYSEYKANRDKTDPVLKQQVQPIKDIVEAWGLPILSIPGYEADDTITTMAVKASKLGYMVYILTSDKDMYQGINERINIIDTQQTERSTKLLDAAIDREGTFKKFGVYPEQIIDFLALQGDKSDNIPGIDGCGDKTAAKWIAKYGSLEGVLANAGEIGGKSEEKIEAAKSHLSLSKALVTINSDVDLGKDVEEFVGCRDEVRLYELTTKYGLMNLKKALGLKNPNAESIVTQYTTDETKIREMLFNKSNSSMLNKPIQIDFFKCEEGVQDLFSTQGNKHLVFKINDEYLVVDVEQYTNELATLAKTLIDSHDFVIVSRNAKDVLKTLGSCYDSIDVFRLKAHDVNVLHYVAVGGQSKKPSIEFLNSTYSHFNLNPLREKYKLNTTKADWNKVPFEDAALIVLEEMQVSSKVYEELTEHLMTKEFAVDSKITPILAYMEFIGAKVNLTNLRAIGSELKSRLTTLEEKIYKEAGKEFNINSPKQVQAVLFEDLEIPSKKKSTAESVLTDLIDKHPIIPMILEHRSVSKLLSTYVTGIEKRTTEKGRVHTTYNQDVTLTGRLSSEDPNLQNIPIRSEDGKRIRSSFDANTGNKILSIDFSQIELRILAHRANESLFIDVFNEGGDIHEATAKQIVETDEVDESQRRRAKTVNFGLIYDISAKGLAKQLGIEKKAAEQFMAKYFEKYVSIKPYFEGELDFAKSNGYVETLGGRKINAGDLNSPNSMVRSHAEKSIKNAGIQATASEVIKAAMIEVFDYILNERNDIKLLMQVHDELVFEVSEARLEETKETLKKLMEEAYSKVYEITLKVPLVADANSGENWNEAH